MGRVPGDREVAAVPGSLAAGLPASQARRRQLLEAAAGTFGVMEFKERNKHRGRAVRQ